MGEKAIHYGVLLGALALAAFVFVRSKHPARPKPAATPAALLALVPPDAALELSCDAARLRASPLGAIVREQLGRIDGGADLERRCGFDPLSLIDQFALSIPAASKLDREAAGDFALLASGPFRAQAIVTCAEQLIRDRGGEPTRSSLGSLLSVRDRKGAGGEVAARDAGPLIVSGGAYFRELVDLANSPTSLSGASTQNPRHAALRRALGDGTLLVTWRVPDGWFGRVADDERAKVSALAAVNALGGRIDLTASGARITALLAANDEPSAQSVANLLGRLKQSAASLLADPLLTNLASRLVLSQEREHVLLRLELSMTEAQTLLARAGDALR